MKRIAKRTTVLLAIGVMLLFLGNSMNYLSAQGGDTTTTGTTKKKKKLDGLVTDWLNDFEACEDWRAISTCPMGDTKIRKIPGKPKPVNSNGKIVNENGQPGEFKTQVSDDNGVTHKNEYVLGVKTYFAERGFDRVEVFPPNEYIIRGKAKEVKVWVLGRKFRHTLYIKLRDFRGRIHKIKIGRLDFWGWKELSVIIPGWLPQSASYAILDKNLHFVSFFVESDKFDKPGTFYFYLDQFRVITDLSEFTGDSSIKDTW
jgi:hypothetical protein